MMLLRNLSAQQRLLVGATTVSAFMAWMMTNRVTKLLDERQSKEDHDDDDDDDEWIQDHQKLSTSFMERLANKPYLSTRIEDGGRPPAVPETLRLMTVDLPNVRKRGLQNSSNCELVSDAFQHGVAAPKRLHALTKRGERPIHIEQKVWVRAFYQCYDSVSSSENKKVGIEIMEADTSTLNPSNVRRMHTLFRYDHGKYTQRKGSRTKQVQHDELTEELDDVDPQEAPWNQQAWMEEAMLRIGGKVKFGAPMEATKQYLWSRWRNNNLSYRSTIPVTTGGWFDILTYIDPAGIDGASRDQVSPSNWSSEKPHAVIANGAVLQRMPQALRLLQKVCKDHDVPLYVLHDPRKWGGNTHDTLGDVLEDLRKTVKKRVVQNSLNYSAGRPFARGRRFGQLETEAKWNIQEANRKANDLLERTNALRKQQKDDDWSHDGAETLIQKLAYHGVLEIEKDRGTIKIISPGMQEIAKKVLVDDTREIEDDLFEKSINTEHESNRHTVSNETSVKEQ